MNYKIAFAPVALLATITLLFAFQNCSVRGGSFLALSESDQKSLESGPKLYGNGEGYGGKLDGIYGAADSLNRCGRATEAQVPIREQIEIRNGMALKTLENCEVLNPPVAFSFLQIQSQSVMGNLFAANDMIFERAPWVSSGLVSREKPVDVFCQNRRIDPQHTEINLVTELSVYKDLSTLPFELPWQSLPVAGFVYNRQAQLATFTQNTETSQVAPINVQTLAMQETMNLNLQTAIFSHSLQTVPSLDPSVFPSVTPTAPVDGSLSPTLPVLENIFTPIQIPDVTLSTCWSNK